MKITILGSGTAAVNLPNIANRFPPGFLVEFGEEKILFDCSVGITERLTKIGADFSRIQHIAICHSHPDHFAFVHYLQTLFTHGLWGGHKSEDINVYAPKFITENFFDKAWNFYWPDRNGKLYDFPKVEFITMPSSEVKIGDATLTAANVYHGFGKIESLAFRLEHEGKVFVYSGDTGMCDGITEITKGADVFICDSTARVGDNEAATNHGHLNPRQAGEIALEANVKHLVLTHYTGLNSEEEMLSDCESSGFKGKISVAKDFQNLEI